jgi:hypothetical protein
MRWVSLKVKIHIEEEEEEEGGGSLREDIVGMVEEGGRSMETDGGGESMGLAMEGKAATTIMP